MEKKIIFFKAGSFSFINTAVEKQLKRIYPEYELQIIDVYELVKDDLLCWKNILHLVMEYGIDFITGRKKWKSYQEWAFVTSWQFDNIIANIKKAAGDYKKIKFTIQTQSIFNASLHGIPHFIYTDSTVLANQQYHLHSRTFMKSKEWMKREKEIYHAAAAIFIFSSNQANSLIYDYGVSADSVICVGAGGNLPVGDSAQYGNSFDKKRILFVGVNWERKGGPLLQKAFQKVLEVHPDAELVVIGCNPQPVNSQMLVLGWTPLNEVDQLYQTSSIFCMPSLQEPFGIVYLEAMERKLPVIANRIGALPDIVEDGISGCLLKKPSANALANIICHLFSNPGKIKKMGEAASRSIQANYTWENVFDSVKQSINGKLIGE